MAFSSDPTTDVGKVRLLITDTRNDVLYLMFQDADIEALLELAGSVYGASALALRAMAVNEVMIQKVQKTLDFQTDGAKVADALRELAKSYETKDMNNAVFLTAEIISNDFQYREAVWKNAERFGVDI